MQSLVTIVKDTIPCLCNIYFLFFLVNTTLTFFNVEIALPNYFIFHMTESGPYSVSRKCWVVLLRQPFEKEQMWLLLFPRFHAFVLPNSIFLPGKQMQRMEIGNHLGIMTWKPPIKEGIEESRQKKHHVSPTQPWAFYLQILCYITKIGFYLMETTAFFLFFFFFTLCYSKWNIII